MNATEWKTWFDHHATLFASWAENRRALSNATDWRDGAIRLMADVSLDDCRQASDDMASRVIAKPVAHDDMIFAIRDRAREIRFDRENTRPAYVGSEPTFRCGLCQDSGFLSRWTAETVQLARCGDFDALIGWWEGYFANGFQNANQRPLRASYKSEAIRCNCIRGDQRSGLARYNPDLDCLNLGEATWRELTSCREFEGGNADLNEALAEW